MNKMFFGKKTKICIDLLLIAGIVFIARCHETGIAFAKTWYSIHCIVSCVWFLILIIHVMQHWKFIKALTKINIALKNKITAITSVCFIFITISILLLVIDVNTYIGKCHNIVGHIFIVIVIIHAIDKFKKILFVSKKKEVFL